MGLGREGGNQSLHTKLLGRSQHCLISRVCLDKTGVSGSKACSRIWASACQENAEAGVGLLCLWRYCYAAQDRDVKCYSSEIIYKTHGDSSCQFLAQPPINTYHWLMKTPHNNALWKYKQSSVTIIARCRTTMSLCRLKVLSLHTLKCTQRTNGFIRAPVETFPCVHHLVQSAMKLRI